MKATHGTFPKEQERLITALSVLPVVDACEWQHNNDDGFDANLDFVDGASVRLIVIVLSRAFPAVLAEKIQNKEHTVAAEDKRYYSIVMAPFISKESAKICEDANIGYMDMSGNCKLCVHSLYVSDIGHPNKFRKSVTVKTVFDPSSKVSSLILRAFMRDVSQQWKLKTLSDDLNCSIGQIAKVKDYLCEQLWAEMQRDGLRILNTEAIMRAWSEAYMKKDNGDEILDCYTLLPLSEFESSLVSVRKHHGIDCYLTGFSGGVRYTPVVRYNKVHLIISQADAKEFMSTVECKVVDSGANVHIRVVNSDELLYDAREINGFQVVSPVQVFLDCSKLKGRGTEMSDAVLSKEIKR